MKLYVRAAVLLIGITSGVSANSQANQPAEQQFSSHLAQLTSAVLADPRHSLDSRALDKIMVGIKPYFRYSVAPAQQTTVNLDTYLATQVPNHKVERGLALLQEHQGLLDKIGERFGVQPRFILALWGIRSNYGEQAGQFPVLTILASQSQSDEAQQASFIDAVVALAQSGLSPQDFVGNRDARLGQVALTASQYLSHGVDGDDDGKVDIWQNHADIFATIANILKQQGWQQEATWGRQVQLPVDFDLSQAQAPQAFSYWQQQGVRRFDGTDLPNVDSIRANVIAPDGKKGRIYLVYDNYRAINAWLDNHYDSISVTYLSERIKFPQLK